MRYKKVIQAMAITAIIAISIFPGAIVTSVYAVRPWMRLLLLLIGYNFPLNLLERKLERMFEPILVALFDAPITAIERG